MTTGLYVYAIIPAGTIEAADLPAGIDTTPLQLVQSNGLAAIVHEHDTRPYQGADEDVKRWILEHSQVVDAAWYAAHTVLPMTFNVIVAPGEHPEQTAQVRLKQWLAGSSAAMTQRLNALRDRVELRVDLALEEQSVVAEHPEIVELQADLADRPAGVQRLYRKRLEERSRAVADQVADQLYPTYRQRLAALAEDLVENARPGRKPESVTVLTASLLVHQDKVDAVGQALAQIRDSQPGAQIRYLGPWPPYSFSEVPDTDVPE